MPLATRLYNITASHEVFAGVRKVFQWTVRDEDDVAVDITGFTFRFVLREKGDVDKTPTLQQTDSAFSIITPASGTVQQEIPAADMPTHGLYEYKVFATDSGNEDVIARGTFLIQP